MSFLSKLFVDSQGLKRKLASILSVILGVAQAVPGGDQIVSIVQTIASTFGISGLVHAASAQTLVKAKLPTVISAISAFIAVAYFVPSLWPVIAPLQKVSAILGAIVVGQATSGQASSER